MPAPTSDRKVESPKGECPLKQCAITVLVREHMGDKKGVSGLAVEVIAPGNVVLDRKNTDRDGLAEFKEIKKPGVRYAVLVKLADKDKEKYGWYTSEKQYNLVPGGVDKFFLFELEMLARPKFKVVQESDESVVVAGVGVMLSNRTDFGKSKERTGIAELAAGIAGTPAGKFGIKVNLTDELRKKYQEEVDLKEVELREGDTRTFVIKLKLLTVGIMLPVKPENGIIRQYVNLPTADQGRDGKGTTVKIKIGARDSRGRIGINNNGSGMQVFVQATFGPDGSASEPNSPLRLKREKSKRADASNKTELLDATGITNAPSRKAKVYKGKVTLGEDGTAEFRVSLGLAGGDTCEVKIGTTDAVDDDKRFFENWRKLYYEVMAPDSMKRAPYLQEVTLADGVTKIWDFPDNVKGRIRDRLGAMGFAEYEGCESNFFTSDQAPIGTWLPESFIKSGGAADKFIYLITDRTAKTNPVAFKKPNNPRQVCLKFCDKNLFFDGPDRGEDPVVLKFDMVAKTQVILDGDVGGGMLEYSACDTRYSDPVDSIPIAASIDGVKRLLWRRKIDRKEAYVIRSTFSAHVQSGKRDGKDCIVKIKETILNREISLTFKNPAIGHIPTAVSNAQETEIGNFVDSLIDPLRDAGNSKILNFQLSSDESASARAAQRLQNIQHAVQEWLRDNKNYVKPLDRAGNLDVSWSDLDVHADITYHRLDKIEIVLPDADPADPGSLVGDEGTVGKCPIHIWTIIEPTSEGLGMAFKEPDGSPGNLFVYNPSSWKPSTDVLLHELGHTMGMCLEDDNIPPPGFSKPKLVSEIDPIFKGPGTNRKGHLYTGKEHSGAHCAWGMSDRKKRSDDYLETGGGTCVMFGHNDTSTNDSLATTGFCDQCRLHIRARNLKDIKDPPYTS